MCELFGLTGDKPIMVNAYLKEFASHSVRHPDGWGMAFFDHDQIKLEKEPIPAYQSTFLEEKLELDTETQNMFAHIRQATKGSLEYENCHPFIRKDHSGRTWTLMHNGTIFSCPLMDKYKEVQGGRTDSERILYYVIDKINEALDQSKEDYGTSSDAPGIKESTLTKEERFHILDEIVCEITPPNNKVNLMIFDGELFYVHTNFKGTLFQKHQDDSVIFATTPLDEEEWTPVLMNTLFAYENGRLLFIGTDHGNEYIYDEEDMRKLRQEGL